MDSLRKMPGSVREDERYGTLCSNRINRRDASYPGIGRRGETVVVSKEPTRAARRLPGMGFRSGFAGMDADRAGPRHTELSLRAAGSV